eukprot:Em0009g859a
MLESAVKSGSITEVIKELESNMDGREPIRITVRRSDIWLDAVQEAKTKGINGLSPLKVTFLAIEFFQQRHFFYFGLFTAMSVVQGGCGIPCLADPVYEYITSGKCSSIVVSSDDIPELAMRDTVEKWKMKDDIVSTLIDYHLILKVKACMDQFCEGLETLGVGSIVRKNPSVLRQFFVFNEVPIDADMLRSILTLVEGNGDVKLIEDLAYFNFNIFLDECDNGPAGGCCSIQELLEFFTGSGYPPQGFSRKCTISFLHDTTARLPTAATCNLELRLPTCHGEDYSQFRECMMLAIRGMSACDYTIHLYQHSLCIRFVWKEWLVSAFNKNRAPLQLWTMGLCTMDESSSSCMVARGLVEPDSESYGIDWNGPVPLNIEHEQVIVDDPPVLLSATQKAALDQQLHTSMIPGSECSIEQSLINHFMVAKLFVHSLHPQ